MAHPFDRDDDATLLARLIWGEARGESLQGKLAVGLTVLTRVPPPGRHRWWGDSLREIMLKPRQYSCLAEDDPNYHKLLNPRLYDSVRAWQDCQDAAGLLLAGHIRDFLRGATHYHRRGRKPSWASQGELVAEIGRHLFYAGVA